jgi:hypothetical protein
MTAPTTMTATLVVLIAILALSRRSPRTGGLHPALHAAGARCLDRRGWRRARPLLCHQVQLRPRNQVLLHWWDNRWKFRARLWNGSPSKQLHRFPSLSMSMGLVRVASETCSYPPATSA